MKTITHKLFLSAAILWGTQAQAGTIKVAASIPDLASIASAIGGSRVETFAIAKPDANTHSVEVLPSYMVKVARAQVYLKVGVSLDGWADAIIQGSRNSTIEVADCSKGVSVLEKPTGKVDASMGDVHPEGNPHYWLDPENGEFIAHNIAQALERVDPAGSSVYEAGLAKFLQDLKAHRAQWNARMAPLKGAAIFTYHSSWPYFAKAFGLRIVGKVEPVPGIPTNARHLQELLDIAKAEHVKILLQEPYFPRDGGEFLHKQASIKPLVLAPSCKGVGASDYFAHFDELVQAMVGG